MKLLVIICSTNPREYLKICIRNVLIYYPTADILVVDSNSVDRSGFDKVKNKFGSKISIYHGGNVNWELGAWSVGYNLYPNYDLYMCIQDTLIPKSIIDIFNIDKNAVYLQTSKLGHPLYGFTQTQSARFVGDGKELIYKMLEGSTYEHKVHKLFDERKVWGYYSYLSHFSFIATTNSNLKNILEALPKLPTTKYESIAFEVLIGMVCKFEDYLVLSGGEAFNKHYGQRWKNADIQR